MKAIYLLKVICHWQLIPLCLFSAVIITGCGSASSTTAGVGSGGTGTLAKISGTVADGYLVNATVFLDRNSNYQLEAGEPSTTSGENGAYTLDVEPADLGKYPIVAHVIQGVTFDKDTNLAVSNSYVLSMPKEYVSGSVSSNFISPISSQLRELMETGRYSSIQHAADTLRTEMGLLAGTEMTADFIAANYTEMHYAAQNMATLMGNQMGHVMGMNGSTITVDVNRYRAMMETIFSNLATVSAENNQTEMLHLHNTITTMLSGMH
jgi:hypothetical protein